MTETPEDRGDGTAGGGGCSGRAVWTLHYIDASEQYRIKIFDDMSLFVCFYFVGSAPRARSLQAPTSNYNRGLNSRGTVDMDA